MTDRSMEYRAGMVRVSPGMLAECNVDRFIVPPEHRLEGWRDEFELGTRCYLLTGPSLPIVAFGDEPRLLWCLFTMHWHPDAPESERFEVTVALSDDAPLVSWSLGKWPDADAFRAWRDGGE